MAGWALALSWWNSRSRVAMFRWCASNPQMLMYYFALTLFLYWSNRGHMSRFSEDHNHLFGSASWSLKFHRWAAIVKSQTEDCFLVSGSCWKTKVQSQTCRCQIFKACEGTTPPYLISVLWSAGGAPKGTMLLHNQVMT